MTAKSTTRKAISAYKFDKTAVFTTEELYTLTAFDNRSDISEYSNAFANNRGLSAQRVVLHKFNRIFPNMVACPRGGKTDMYDPLTKIRVEVKYLSKSFVYGTDLKFTIELDYNHDDNLFVWINMGDQSMPIYRRLFGNVCIVNGYHLRWCDLYNMYHEVKTLHDNTMKNTFLLHEHLKYVRMKAMIDQKVNERVEAELESRIGDRIALTDSLIEDISKIRETNAELSTRADDYRSLINNIFDLLTDAQKHQLLSRNLDLSEFMDVEEFERKINTNHTTPVMIGCDSSINEDISMVPEQRNTTIEDFINQQWVTDTLYHYGMPYKFFASEYEKYCLSHGRTINTIIRKKDALTKRFADMLEQTNGTRRLSANINGVLQPTNKRAIIFNNTYSERIKDRVTDYRQMDGNPYLRSTDYLSLISAINISSGSINDIDYESIPDRSDKIRFIDPSMGKQRIKSGCGESSKFNGNYIDIITFFKAYASLMATEPDVKRTRNNAFVEYELKGETITVNASRWTEMLSTKNKPLYAFINEHCFNRAHYNRDIGNVTVCMGYIVDAIKDAVAKRIPFEQYEIKLSTRSGSLKNVCYKLICNSGDETRVEWISMIRSDPAAMEAIRGCLIENFNEIRKHKLDIFKTGPRTTCSCISVLVTEMRNRARFVSTEED